MADASPNIGTRIGGYRIEKRMGAGAMGAVYVAVHDELDRKLAVKFLHPAQALNPTIAGRFLMEARALGALDHPNIVKVHDSNELPDGRHYLAMEFLEGATLGQYLRKNEPTFDQTLRVLAQICYGLAAIHFEGIIHRDLKLGNIFVCETKENPLHIKLLDFGLAKLANPGGANEVQTQTGVIGGTPGYMAPEQARGMRDIDHRADIYAVGTVAYRMLTKKLPFEGENIADVLYKQATTTPVHVQALRRDMPERWGELIMSALSIEPAKRPADATSFIKSLATAIPYGIKSVQKVAPLLVTEDWLANTKPLPPEVLAKRRLRQVASGSTVNYQDTDDGLDSPRTLKAQPAVPIAPQPETLQAISRPTLPLPQRPPRRGVIGLVLVLLAAVLIAGTVALVRPNEEPKAALEFVASKFDAGAEPAPADAAQPSNTAVLADASVRVDAAPAKPTAKAKKPGRLRVSVSPWASVKVNGKARGNAPVSISLAPGRYRVTLSGPKTETVRIKIRPGKTTNIVRKWSARSDP